MFSKKAISSIIVVLLFLTVTILAIFSLQTFFLSQNSKFEVQVQQGTSIQSEILDVVGSKIFLKNSNPTLIVDEIIVDGTSCGISGNYSGNVIEIDLKNCSSVKSETFSNIEVISNEGILYKQLTFGKIPLICPSGYIKVPGNSAYGTSDFCIMKYEAKSSGGVPTSQPTGTFFHLTTQSQARNNCSSLGSGYHLTTENEWLTVAKNIEQVSSNWNSSIVGTGFIYSGHNDNSPSSPIDASLNDSDGYINTGQTTGNQRRTLNLSNGNIIWDFAGNLFEWTNETIAVASRYEGGTGTGVYTYNAESGQTNTTNTPALKRPSNGWDGDEGMGRYTDGNNALAYEDASGCGPGFCSSTAAFLRSGSYLSGVEAGIFSLTLNVGPNRVDTKLGFRCAYTG